jgi:cyclase
MVSKAAIRGAVNTHYHFDHTFGNFGYAEQRIPILAHEKVSSLMKTRYADLKGADKTALLAPLEERLARAADDTDRKRRQADLDAWKSAYAAIDAATIVFPTEPLKSADLPKRIDLGGAIAILEHHPAHTPTDLIVRVPAHDVVFAGDLLFHRRFPVSIDADMIAWRKVLDRFAGYGRRTRFIPGHGPVCGLDTVREQSALFDDLRAHAEKMMRAGASAEEAERRYVVPERFSSWGMRSWDFTVGAAMRSYFARLGSARRVL